MERARNWRTWPRHSFHARSSRLPAWLTQRLSLCWENSQPMSRS
ncbi:putative galacturonosyltransferase 7 [Senna tora]|uniref:Putative galacturonosyltransferase 7 n=1 Tax=Senna tora TaxID=362788 RepID=A0A834XHH7_9FABA|nr:putative galacturonosyltransferase 7 [Senna tora]